MMSDQGTDRPTSGGTPNEDGPAGSPQAGVLGNLPRSRPAVRSPRRREPKPAVDPAADAARAAAESRPDPSTTPRAGSTEDGPGTPAADLEALARGGLAVAGSAATLGLRLAGRTAAAVRSAVERR